MTDPNCACNDLTNFEYEAQAMTGNGSYVNMMKRNLLSKHVKSHQVNLFLADFSYLELLCKVG